MVLNEPAHGPEKKEPADPWGSSRRKKEEGPPDLDQLLQQLIAKIKKQFGVRVRVPLTTVPPGKPSKHGSTIFFLILLLPVLWIISGFFIVNPAEEAVTLRFGKYQDTRGPGLHWIPQFIDSKYLVDAQKIYAFSLKGDFLTKSSDRSDQSKQAIEVKEIDNQNAVDDDATKDKNIVNVELSVQYRISNARDYLFNTTSASITIREAAASALSDVMGKMKLKEVLTVARDVLSAGVHDRLQEILARYQPGLTVVTVNLRRVQAPEEVRDAFNDVIKAGQDRQTAIQQAQAYASNVVPIAQGQAKRILADATATQQQVILRAKGNVAAYEALLKVYEIAPQVTRERLYLDAIESMLKHSSKVLIDVNKGHNVLYLPLEQLINTKKNTDEQDEKMRLLTAAVDPSDQLNIPALPSASGGN